MSLDNYNNIEKFEKLIDELEVNYEYGDHTDSYLKLSQFFKYNDLVDKFTALKKHRDSENGYKLGTKEYEELHDSYTELMKRLKQEVPQNELQEICNFL